MSYLNKIYNSLTTTDLTAKQTFYGKLSSTPADSDYASGEVALYVKDDGGLYKRPNGGTEALVADGGSSYSLPTDIESGGSAEMSVQGLSGDLAAAQDPKSHGNTAHSTNFASTSHDNASHSTNFASTSHDNTSHSTNFASDSHDNASHSTNFSPNSHDHSSETLGGTTPLTGLSSDTLTLGGGTAVDAIVGTSGEWVPLGSGTGGASVFSTTNTSWETFANTGATGVIPGDIAVPTNIQKLGVNFTANVKNDTSGETTSVRLRDHTNSQNLTGTEVNVTATSYTPISSPIVQYDPGSVWHTVYQAQVTAGTGDVAGNATAHLYGQIG
jgi:hypothetical protein